MLQQFRLLEVAGELTSNYVCRSYRGDPIHLLWTSFCRAQVEFGRALRRAIGRFRMVSLEPRITPHIESSSTITKTLPVLAYKRFALPRKTTANTVSLGASWVQWVFSQTSARIVTQFPFA